MRIGKARFRLVIGNRFRRSSHISFPKTTHHHNKHLLLSHPLVTTWHLDQRGVPSQPDGDFE
jgi:hypothetical protein